MNRRVSHSDPRLPYCATVVTDLVVWCFDFDEYYVNLVASELERGLKLKASYELEFNSENNDT